MVHVSIKTLTCMCIIIVVTCNTNNYASTILYVHDYSPSHVGFEPLKVPISASFVSVHVLVSRVLREKPGEQEKVATVPIT